jgi:hypothetical protein
MNPPFARRRQHLLQEMDRIERMELGALAEDYHTRSVGGVEVKTGPYFKHQQWKDGRNCSRRVPPEEAASLREAIEGRQHFEKLAQEFIEVTVAQSRAQAALPESKKNFKSKSKRRNGPKPPPSSQ